MSWVLTAKVGDKVTPVGDKWRREDGTKPSWKSPEVGVVYTIRHIMADEFGVFFLLEEIVNLSPPGELEPDFHYIGFRPVQYRPTDISFAHDILKSVSEMVGEDA